MIVQMIKYLVVGTGDGSETFLASGVPDLKFNILAIDWEGSKPEIDSDGGKIGVAKRIISEPEEEGTLSNAGVSDDDKLEQVIVLFDHLFFGIF